ncbi:putative WRKY transcription factor 72 [Citrus sinensis]|nr:putative WRKY transcription factor 72 [Citrus sinensis]
MPCVVKEEKSAESINHEHICSQEARKVGIGGQIYEVSGLKSSSPSRHEKLAADGKEEDELESAKAEMGEVREENERLKKMLEQIEKDYKSLQLRFFDILQKADPAKKSTNSTQYCSHDGQIMESELVSLCLGRSSSPGEAKKEERTSNNASKSSRKNGDDEELKASLNLALDPKIQPSLELGVSNLSPENSSEETKEEEAGEAWPPSKVLKTMRGNGDDEVSPHSNVKRARVSVRARCDAPTVQRCAEDMSILITTYEGTHSHPLPVSATAMASTTSAAASMLLSGSSTSQPGLSSTAPTTTAATAPNGLNFNIYDTSRTKPFYSSNSTSALFPTITLDLTNPSSSFSHFNRFSSSFASNPRFPSTNLNFSCSSESTLLPTLWGNGFQAYGPYNQTPNGSLSNLGKNSQEQFYQSFMDKNQNQQAAAASASQQALTETLTKAMTSDPNFRSVIAAAISTMVGGNATNNGDQENFGQNLMQNNTPPNNSILSQNGKACASGYFNGLSTLNSQTGSSSLLQSSLPFPIFKSSPTPTNDNNNKDQSS